MGIVSEQLGNDIAAQNADGRAEQYERCGRYALCTRRCWLGLTLGALVLYMLTLAPSVMPGDYAEFQFSAAILGVPHPTGYSLYILLGKLFTLLPFGDVAYRVNLSSAVYMAAAVGVGYAVALKLLRLVGWGRVVVGGGGGSCAVCYFAHTLVDGAGGPQLRAQRAAGGLGALRADNVAHHATPALVLPGGLSDRPEPGAPRHDLPAVAGLRPLSLAGRDGRFGATAKPGMRRPPRTVRRLLLGGLCLLAGLSPLLFLVYRFVWGSPYYWGSPTTWKDFFDLL